MSVLASISDLEIYAAFLAAVTLAFTVAACARCRRGVERSAKPLQFNRMKALKLSATTLCSRQTGNRRILIICGAAAVSTNSLGCAADEQAERLRQRAAATRRTGASLLRLCDSSARQQANRQQRRRSGAVPAPSHTSTVWESPPCRRRRKRAR